MSFVAFIFSHKLLLLLVAATAALGISTIVLGVDNADLKDQLEESNNLKTTPSRSTTLVPNTTPVPGTTIAPTDMSKYRLPSAIVPIRYDLYLYPDLKTGLFRGKVLTEASVQEATSDIVLNGHLLHIDTVSVNSENGTVEMDSDFERFTVRTHNARVFESGSIINISIDFSGDMKDRIVGLYSSSYVNEKGEQRLMATSKFEPTYARQAFPCFDEPNMKATYKVHILKPNDDDYIALSNNPVEQNETVAEGVMVHFEETVPMSTYLSCFIVSDFKHTETTFQNKDKVIPFKVYASPEQLDKTVYAGQVGKDAIEYYVEYFNIPYPLPKLDLVAIPDFVSGAMEHWGLVTFRETALLYTETTHSASNKQRVAEVVAHELAHSWFGNLVTMDWWNNLWLNEGFATYIEYKGVNEAQPDWQMMDQFLIGTMHSVLSLDATQGSHPIIQTVVTPDQITEVFDSISYNKGASVLRMLEDAVSPAKFQQGVTNYLNKHQYSNAVTDDLWREIQGVVDDIEVKEFMDTFTVQMGLPIVDVKVDGNKYTLTQKRFLLDYSTVTSQPNSPLGYKWNIPIKYITDKNQASEAYWFNQSATELVIEVPSGDKFVKFNPSQVGYYRVNYPLDVWQILTDNIGSMSIADQTHLLEESFSISASGELSYSVPLDLTKYLEGQSDYIPWSVASSKLQEIAANLQNSQSEKDFKAYIVKLLKPAYESLKEEGTDDTHLTKLARVVILNLACVVEYDEALNYAKSKFTDWISDPDNVQLSPDLRSIFYKFGMVTADEVTWNALFERFAAEKDANEKLKLMNGLANVRNPSLLSRLINLAENDETYVRQQDYFTLLQYISANPIGTPIVWDYVRENWDALVSRFTLNDRYLGRLIPSITSRFSTNIKLNEMNQFFETNPDAGAGASARIQALESVNNNIQWLKQYKDTIEEWVRANTK